ncbi:MAG: ABC transporter ATP-binding protein [Pseudomonadota bacterium]
MQPLERQDDLEAGAATPPDQATVAPTDYVNLRAISHSYGKSDRPTLHNIDMAVARGEIVALLGRSGSGKSTLLHIIAGLLRPSSGVVRVGGNLVEKPSPSRVMMFQSPSLFPWMTVAQNAGLGLRYARKKDGMAERVAEVLALVDLAEFSDRNVQDLSGGQQQRVAFARSIATEPELLLLDEPFSALDIFTRRTLQNDIRQIVRRLGLTMIFVTHDVAEAVQMADRSVLMNSVGGQIAQDTQISVAEADRLSQSRNFQMEVTRLRTLYSEVAGVN